MPRKKTWPGVDPGGHEHSARVLADKQRERLRFSSEHLEKAKNVYVAWLDLMGAGNVMLTSMQRSANAIARLHMAAHYACSDHGYTGSKLSINDGMFLITESKREIMTITRSILVMLTGNFVARPNHADRFLIRGAIAFGPVYYGADLARQLEKKHQKAGVGSSFNSTLFGPPIIQAYHSETSAPPYGIAIHESARAFCPPDELPFRSRLWFWWQANDDNKIPSPCPQTIEPLKNVFAEELADYLDYLESTSSIHNLSRDKILELKNKSHEYFVGYSKTQKAISKAAKVVQQP